MSKKFCFFNKTVTRYGIVIPMTKLIIIGAGITGLTLARELIKSGQNNSLCILEKSRGLGGRLATRRGESTRFDHGIPEITPAELALLGISRGDFPTEGATSIAKHMARDLPVEKNTRAIELRSRGSHWEVITECGKSIIGETIILTAPLPQALELLKKSAIAYAHELETIHYEMAIVALLEGSGLPTVHAITRNPDSDFLSIVNEHEKGISSQPAWTLTFSPEWSRTRFEWSEEDIRDAALSALKRKWPSFAGSIEIKKWRYSKPIGHFPGSFFKVASKPDLYLAGDAFCKKPEETNFSNAIRSALELSSLLQNK